MLILNSLVLMATLWLVLFIVCVNLICWCWWTVKIWVLRSLVSMSRQIKILIAFDLWLLIWSYLLILQVNDWIIFIIIPKLTFFLQNQLLLLPCQLIYLIYWSRLFLVQNPLHHACIWIILFLNYLISYLVSLSFLNLS